MSSLHNEAFLPGAEVRTLFATIEELAVQRELSVATAVVDYGGRLMALSVMPGTLLTSDRVAIGKAFTSATFARPTRSLIAQIPAETRAALTAADQRVCFIVGGLPLLCNGTCIGGIGISGGPADVDEELAVAAVDHVLGGGW